MKSRFKVVKSDDDSYDIWLSQITVDGVVLGWVPLCRCLTKDNLNTTLHILECGLKYIANSYR